MGMVPPFLDNPYEPDLTPSGGPVSGLYWPVALILLSLLVWFTFQLSQILAERGNLDSIYAAQEPLMANATRMRSTMDALANGTSRLSAAGNANAKRFIETMAKQGITFNPPADIVLKPETADGAKGP